MDLKINREMLSVSEKYMMVFRNKALNLIIFYLIIIPTFLN